MSKSWDELKNISNFREQIEIYWSHVAGELSAKKEHGNVTVKAEAYTKKTHGIELNIASLREGIISIEDHLTKIEERLDALEEGQLGDLDKHR
jgi:predicted  nucleic acid-binding Zn-ribbon protein